MPTLDGGHYFLTALIPIDNHHIYEEGGVKSSPVDLVREALEVLPTALQSPATVEIGIPSPFARSLRTHFARLFVVETLAYNGRDPVNALEGTFKGVDLLQAQPVDGLNTPYLVFVADFDPVGDEPRSYLEELWRLTSRELRTVFGHCYGFTPQTDAAAFADLVIKGQVETTMPYNDYWTIPPPFPTMPLWTLLIAPAIGAVLGVGVGIGLGGLMSLPWLGTAAISLAAALALVAFGLFVDVQLILAWGQKPFPTAPNSTLRDVLKALYLQHAFTRFARDHQGQGGAALRAAFTAFTGETRPADVSGPTQPPGVIAGVVAKESAGA